MNTLFIVQSRRALEEAEGDGVAATRGTAEEETRETPILSQVGALHSEIRPTDLHLNRK